MSRRPALFVDRDGTLIEDTGYLSSPDDVRLLPGVIEGLTRARDLGMDIVVVSNQSGVGRGMYGRDDLDAVDAELRRQLGDAGIELAASYYCVHQPSDGCDCRKPAPGMMLAAAADLAIDLARSTTVGDRERDVEAGLAAGTTAVSLGFDSAHAGVARVRFARGTVRGLPCSRLTSSACSTEPAARGSSWSATPCSTSTRSARSTGSRPRLPFPWWRSPGANARPGGAANAAVCVAALGPATTLCGTVGDDESGSELVALLARRGSSPASLRAPTSPRSPSTACGLTGSS